MNISIKAVTNVYKWTYRVGLVLAGFVILFHYGHNPTPIPYLADIIRIILILYGIGFSVALYKVYNDIPDDAPLADFTTYLPKFFYSLYFTSL